MSPCFRLIIIVAVCVLSVIGCNQPPQIQQPRYGTAPAKQQNTVFTFAVHPLHNPQKLNQAYLPLIEHLNRQLKGVRLELEASRDYGNYEEKVKLQKPDFLLPNPWQTLEAMKTGYHVIAMAGDPQDFKGIFVVRRDGGIVKPSDLKGKAVSYPSPTALAACIMPQNYLHKQGIDINKDIKNIYVGSQESSIMNVFLGQTAAGATWPPPWRAFQRDHPAEAAQLKVIWETPHLLNNSVMARNNVPPQIRDQIRSALTQLQDTPQGKEILAGMETARFHAATDSDYEVVRRYVKQFEETVRPVKQK